MKEPHKAKRLGHGKYLYRGVNIRCIGYYPPEQCVMWEAVDDDRTAWAHGRTLREVKMWIDLQLDKR